jgi:hypothetical protein
MRRFFAILLSGIAALAPAAAPGDQPKMHDALAEFSGPAAVPVEALAAAIGAWLSATFDLPAAPLPAIRFASPEAMASRYRGAEAAAEGGRTVVALYDRRARTIHLPEGWTGARAAEVSVLVHEMVHHLQHVAGHRFGCPGQAEALAYEAQGRWLAHFGRDIGEEFAVDPLFLRLLAVCGF